MKSFGRSGRQYGVIAALSVLVVSGFFFQNCMGISPEAIHSTVEKTNSLTPEITVGTTVVCDPLQSGSVCTPGTNDGLLGNLYSYPNGVGVNNYIQHGEKLNVLILMSNLDISLRSWTSGFPGNEGLLKNSNGEVLFEYFALDLKGFFTVPLVDQGKYQFALASDDGAMLDINNQTIIDNDGTHSFKWKCSSSVNGVQLNADENVPIRVRYYQGPRTEIGLQVFWRPWSQRNSPCNASGGWQILPSSYLTH